MINLLPNYKKLEIRAARTNVILFRYLFIVLLATGFILGAMYVTRTVLAMTKTNSEQIIASNDLKADIYSSTKAEVDNLSAGLVQAKSLLSQETRYSQVLINIGQLMPANTVFEKLTLDTNSFNGTPVTTKMYAKTTAEATALDSSFKSSPLFSIVKISNILEGSSELEGYPVSADITFTLNRAVAK